MKRKWIKMITAWAVFSVLFAGTAFAGTWLKGEGVNQDKWWYANEDGTYANSGWFWIDGDNNSIAESYCFDAEGWLYVNTTTPDGDVVNENGAWVSEGQVMTQAVEVPAAAPAVDSALASIGGTYKYTGLRRNAITGEVGGWVGMIPEEVTVTVVEANTINLNFSGTNYGTSTYVFKKNGDIFAFDSLSGGTGSMSNSVYANEVRYDGNRIEVADKNPITGISNSSYIFER